jgi:hypothetical protein
MYFISIFLLALCASFSTFSSSSDTLHRPIKLKANIYKITRQSHGFRGFSGIVPYETDPYADLPWPPPSSALNGGSPPSVPIPRRRW